MKPLREVASVNASLRFSLVKTFYKCSIKSVKNICKTTANGRSCWMVHLTIAKGKRIKRYFKTEALAKDFLKKYREEQAKGIRGIAELPPMVIADIQIAISLLPKNMTLSDCVRLASNRTPPSKTINEVIDEFLALKKPNLDSQYYQVVKGRLRKFKEAASSFDNVSSENVMIFCKSVSNAPKTQRHYIALLKEFFDFAARKGYYTPNPFDSIHESEIPKLKRRAYKIPPVGEIEEFFLELENAASNLAGLYALVAFGGLRIAEAQRLTRENFNFERKEIILPFGDSKTGQTWLQANMPENVWRWLEKYPPNEGWGIEHIERAIKPLRDKFKFEHNALRHAFATYHLSLYRDAPRTQILMRHTSPAMLWQTYLAGLTDEKTAQEYFSIAPAGSPAVEPVS